MGFSIESPYGSQRKLVGATFRRPASAAGWPIPTSEQHTAFEKSRDAAIVSAMKLEKEGQPAMVKAVFFAATRVTTTATPISSPFPSAPFQRLSGVAAMPCAQRNAAGEVDAMLRAASDACLFCNLPLERQRAMHAKEIYIIVGMGMIER